MPQLLATGSVMISKRWKSIRPTSVGNHSTSKNSTRYFQMIKSAFAALAAAPLFAGAAMAGPYVNVEANSGFSGSNYSGTTTDLHVGYEGALGESASWYAQAGPSIATPDGGETSTVFSGKAGVGVAATESLGIYGEISFATVDGGDNNYGTKVGLKYSF